MGERIHGMEDIFQDGIDDVYVNGPTVWERIYGLAGQLYCASGLSSWCFSRHGELKVDSFPSYRQYLTFFQLGGCLEYALKHADEVRGPMLLTDPLDMMWITDCYFEEGKLNVLFVCGPVFNTRSSVRNLEAALRKLNVSAELRQLFLEKLEIVPVLSQANIIQYVKMLHYTLTGKYISAGGIHYQSSERQPDEANPPLVNNPEKEMAVEKAIVQMIREGKIYSLGTVDKQASFLSAVGFGMNEPKRESRNYMIIFTALCTRAAMEGGLAPSVAKQLEAHYIRCIEKSNLITDLINLKYAILEDFTTRVRACRQSPEMSPAIQACCVYIQSHLCENLELENIARAVGYTEYYLTKKFYKETGIRLADYIKGARIEQAKIMLMSGQSVQSISDDLQFSARSYFSKVFKDTVGMTPAEYRMKNGRGETE